MPFVTETAKSTPVRSVIAGQAVRHDANRLRGARMTSTPLRVELRWP